MGALGVGAGGRHRLQVWTLGDDHRPDAQLGRHQRLRRVLFAVGALLFTAVVLFQLVTLPVEFDASARAKKLAFDYGLVSAHEREGVPKVLNAAALTYVAAAASSILTLLYFLMRAGLLGGRRD